MVFGGLKMKYVPISPLTWPGGKFRSLPEIIPRIPEFQEYREPFVGAGHVFFKLRNMDLSGNKKYWINDLNPDLTNFYIWSKSFGSRITKDILKLKSMYGDGKELLNYVMNLPETGYNKALRFFVLNRITFYGIGVSRQHTETKSYSVYKYQRKFTEELINRVAACEDILQHVKITNNDYSTLLRDPGEKVFLFLDPPWHLDSADNFYGKNGSFHKNFDLNRLSEELQSCSHTWLMTMADRPEYRDIFSWAYLEPLTVKYSMGSVGTHDANELYVSNFKPRFRAPTLEAFLGESV